MQPEQDSPRELSPEEVRQLLIAAFLELSPLIARRLPMQEVVGLLKACMVFHMLEEEDMSPVEAGEALGIGERSIYRHAQEFQVLRKTIPPDRLRVLEFFVHRYPEWDTIDGCHKYLVRRKASISQTDIESIVDKLVQSGILKKENARYVVSEGVKVVRAPDVARRAEIAPKLLRTLLHVFGGFVGGRTRVRSMKLELRSAAFLEGWVSFEQAVVAVGQKVMTSQFEEDPHTSEPRDDVEVFLIMGPTKKFLLP